MIADKLVTELQSDSFNADNPIAVTLDNGITISVDKFVEYSDDVLVVSSEKNTIYIYPEKISYFTV